MKNNPITINGITLVSIEIAKELKKLGWCRKTPAIYQLSTNTIFEPQRHINTNIGNDFYPLPALQQVIEWLEQWGIILTWENFEYNGINYYVNAIAKGSSTWGETKPQSAPDEYCFKNNAHEWYKWDDMILGIIPLALELIEKEIHEKFVTSQGKTMYSLKHCYDYMVENHYIVPTDFYDFSSPVDYRLLTGKDFIKQ